MLKLECSNYDDFDQSLISSSDSDLETCTDEEETLDYFCYDKLQNDFEYKICPNQPKPGKWEVLKHVFPCFSLFKKLLKVIETRSKVKTCLISAGLIFKNLFLLFYD